MTAAGIAISQVCFKVCLAFHDNEQIDGWLLLNEDGWHKILNIFMLVQFCSLAIYLGRVNQEFYGQILGVGVIIILVSQERDFLSFKCTLIPVIYNNSVLVIS